MEPYYTNGQATIFHGDCRAVLAGMAAGSFDCCVTDPPYGLEFMGKDWDNFKTYDRGGRNMKPRGPNVESAGGEFPYYGYRQKQPRCRRCGKLIGRGTGVCKCPEPIVDTRTCEGANQYQFWCEEWAGEVWRVLKPGGVLMAFGGTRTWHRLACAIEDAGFVVFDTLMWLYGQGFPKHKSLLKPAWEPIICAKKPEAGGLQTEAGRIGMTRDVPASLSTNKMPHVYSGGLGGGLPQDLDPNMGRWPSNVCLSHVPPDEHGAGGCVEVGVRRVKGTGPRAAGGKRGSPTVYAQDAYSQTYERIEHDGYADPDGFEAVPAYRCVAECPIAMLDAQAGESVSRIGKPRAAKSSGDGWGDSMRFTGTEYNDSGGASRFFYCSKAPANQRIAAADGTRHPTQKPEDLMRWLVRLACPPGGRLLDPFCGSGTTIKAAIGTAAEAVGIDAELAYCEIAATRTSQPALVLTTY